MTTCSICKKELHEVKDASAVTTKLGSKIEWSFICSDCLNNPFRRPGLDIMTNKLKEKS